MYKRQVEYIEGKPKRVDTIVVSAQHGPEVERDRIQKDIIEHVIRPIVPSDLLDENTRFLVNPTGRFIIGGPNGCLLYTSRCV